MLVSGSNTNERQNLTLTDLPMLLENRSQTPYSIEQIFFITKSNYNRPGGSVKLIFIANNRIKELDVKHQSAMSFLDRFGLLYALGQDSLGHHYCKKVTSRVRDNGERVFTTNPYNSNDDRLRCLSPFKNQQPVKIRTVEEFHLLIDFVKIPPKRPA